MSDEQRYDDEITRPVEGAAAGSAAEGGTSPAVGRDESDAEAADPVSGAESAIRRGASRSQTS